MGKTLRLIWPQAHMFQHVCNALVDLAVAGDAVEAERRFERAADGLAWIERRVRVLEDHLGKSRAVLPIPTGASADILTVEHDAASCWCLQPEDGKSEGRLSATGFADKAEAFAAFEFEIDAIYRV